MKILFISSSRKGKGISPFINAQAESLRKRGIVIETFQIEGNGLFAYIKSIPKIHKLSKTFNILHAHYGFSGIASRLANFKIPLVVSFLGDDLEGTPNNKGTYTFKGKVFVALNKFFARYFFDFSIVKSESLSQKLPNVKIKAIIPNGIDFQRFYSIGKEDACKELNLNSDKNYILFPSTPKRPVKNYKLYQEAMKHLAGDVKELILENVSPDKVYLYYNAACVTVLTSFHEGSPNVVKEALACNCPVVATPVGDVPELLSGLKNCYVSNPDPEKIAESIKNILYSGERTESRNSIQHLEDGKIADKIISIYQNLIKN